MYEPRHKVRLAIKPGITGMWQVSGRSDITDFEEVVRLDNDNIWVQIVLWGMILANICMLEEVFEDEMKIDSGLSVEM